MIRLTTMKKSIIGNESLKYLAVSVLALLADILVLFLLSKFHELPPIGATFFAYLSGMLVHYILSINYVFGFRKFSATRWVEFGWYILTGLRGAGLSALLVWQILLFDGSLGFAKLIAIPVVFISTLAVRKFLLFTPPR